MQKKQKKSYFERKRQQIEPELLKKWQNQQKKLRQKIKQQDLIPDMPQKIAGLDLSSSQQFQNVAVATIVILDYKTRKLLYQDSILVKLNLPYVPGLLAFRQLGPILQLFNRLKKKSIQLIPDVILNDGNGILHCNGFGLASHLGVLLGIPTIGCGKTMFYVDGITKQAVSKMGLNLLPQEHKILIGKSKRQWGAILRSNQQSKNPIIISIGNLISLGKAIQIVKSQCKFRVPQPIRLADKISRKIISSITKQQAEKAAIFDLILQQSD